MKLPAVVLLFVFPCGSGCDLAQLRDAAQETNPATGTTAVQDLIADLPSLIAQAVAAAVPAAAPVVAPVVGNPIDTWTNVGQNLLLLLAAGFGWKEWRKYRPAKAPTSPFTEILKGLPKA